MNTGTNTIKWQWFSFLFQKEIKYDPQNYSRNKNEPPKLLVFSRFQPNEYSGERKHDHRYRRQIEQDAPNDIQNAALKPMNAMDAGI